MRRLLGTLLVLLLAAVVVVLTWPELFRLQRDFPVAQVLAFRTATLVAFAGVLVVALLLLIPRSTRIFATALALVAAVAVGANGLALASRGFGGAMLPAKTEASIRVMTWNTAGSATSPESIAQTAVAIDADVVALPETTIETAEQVAIAMRGLGNPMWGWHTEYGTDGWAASSTALLISPRLGDYSVIPASQEGTSTVPSAIAMPVSGDGPVIVAAHAVAPRESAMADWRSDLQWLADQCGSDDVIMAGDFNATLDHMAGLGTDGATLGRCHDAAATTGNGAVGTWPTRLPAAIGAPIDHVMATDGWRASGSTVLKQLDALGSDHRPLVVQLEPAR